MIRSYRFRTMAVTMAAGLSLLAAGPVRAFESPSSGCFQTAPLWNAPDGAAISMSSDGPIKVVLNAVGETRTHVMIANTSVGWATQSTSLQPSHQNDESQPLIASELASGYPGFSQTNMGGAYAYLQDSSEVRYHYPPPPVRSFTSLTQCGERCQVQGVANYLWSNIPYTSAVTVGSEFLQPFPGGGGFGGSTLGNLTPTSAPPLFYFYLLGSYDDGGAGNFVHFPYQFNQYMRGAPRIWGSSTGYGWNRGIVCSEVGAYGWAQWAMNTSPNLPPEATTFQPFGHYAIPGHQYGVDETKAAASALWVNISNQCLSNFDAWTAAGAIIFYQINPARYCANMANQVVRCFSEGGDCSNVADNWQITNGAFSFSPDVMVGYHKTTEWAGPWSHAVPADLQWNGGGSNYGCWE